jgi:hypothetical protein
MAYIPNNLLCLSTNIANKGITRWTLSGTDADTVVRVAGYITDAKKKGMKTFDLVEYAKTDTTPPAVFEFIVSAINATTGAGDLSNATVITATNSD